MTSSPEPDPEEAVSRARPRRGGLEIAYMTDSFDMDSSADLENMCTTQRVESTKNGDAEDVAHSNAKDDEDEKRCRICFDEVKLCGFFSLKLKKDYCRICARMQYWQSYIFLPFSSTFFLFHSPSDWGPTRTGHLFILMHPVSTNSLS
jgi:hypothetical protein